MNVILYFNENDKSGIPRVFKGTDAMLRWFEREGVDFIHDMDAPRILERLNLGEHYYGSHFSFHSEEVVE